MRRAVCFTLVLMMLASFAMTGCTQSAPAPAPSPAPKPAASPPSSPAPAPSPATPAKQYTQIRYVGAPTGSDNYTLGAIFADYASKALGIPAGVLPGGSVENIKAIDRGDAEIGYCSVPDAYNGFRGLAPFDRQYDKIRFLDRYSTVSLTFAVRMDSDIKTIPDLLKGKKVAIGTGGSAAELITLAVLEAGYGIKPEDIQKGGGVVSRISYADMGTGLADKTLDCVALFAYQSAVAKNHLAAEERFGLRLLPVDDAAMTKILAKYPFYTKGQMDGGLYKGSPTAVPCVALSFIQITSKDLPDDLVYKIMDVLWNEEVVKKVIASAPALPDYQLKWALREGYNVIPVHPGAAKWYKDKGMTLPAEAKVG